MFSVRSVRSLFVWLKLPSPSLAFAMPPPPPIPLDSCSRIVQHLCNELNHHHRQLSDFTEQETAKVAERERVQRELERIQNIQAAMRLEIARLYEDLRQVELHMGPPESVGSDSDVLVDIHQSSHAPQ
jgi:hypothetical protein